VFIGNVGQEAIGMILQCDNCHRVIGVDDEPDKLRDILRQRTSHCIRCMVGRFEVMDDVLVIFDEARES